MRAIRIHGFGGPEALSMDEVPIPTPGDREALVRVLAAGVNPVDGKIRSGSLDIDAHLPITLGAEVSGTIEFCGRDFRDFEVGEPVYAFLEGSCGGYADYVLIREHEAARKPRDLDPVAAGAVPLAASTAWQGLVELGGLAAGERVLVLGAAGGVGHLAVQIARHHGAQVIAGIRGDHGDFVRSLGADAVLDTDGGSLPEQSGPVDLVLDLVGPAAQAKVLPCLRDGGRIVSTVAAPAEEDLQGRGLTGQVFVATPRRGRLATIARLIDEGVLVPAIDRVFAFEEADAAQLYLETAHHRGRVVLDTEASLPGEKGVLGERLAADTGSGATDTRTP